MPEGRQYWRGETVARLPDRIATPVNQLLTPVGIQVELPGLRPQALALSPDGKILVTAGETAELLVLAPDTGHILQRVPMTPERGSSSTNSPITPQIQKPDKGGQLSFTGLIFSRDGRKIYLANVDGSIKVFGVEKDGEVIGLRSFPLPPANAPHRKAEIPAGLALSRDGKRLYVALNLSNRLGELDTETGQMLRSWDVGVAPYDVVLVKNKAYVSNWGGRRPETGDLTGPAGRGMRVRVDPIRHIASEGTITVIDLNERSFSAPRTLTAGLHSSAMALAPTAVTSSSPMRPAIR